MAFPGIPTGKLCRDAKMEKAGNYDVLRFAIYTKATKKDGEDLLVDCTMFGSRGEKLVGYLLKGVVVSVMGMCDLNKYKDREGVEHVKVVCNVSDIQMHTKAPEAQAPQKAAGAATSGGGSADDQDLPF